MYRTNSDRNPITFEKQMSKLHFRWNLETTHTIINSSSGIWKQDRMYIPKGLYSNWFDIHRYAPFPTFHIFEPRFPCSRSNLVPLAIGLSTFILAFNNPINSHANI